jgi:Protein of unknown function (DUF3347)
MKNIFTFGKKPFEMKKFVLLIVVFGLAAFLAWKLLSDKPVRNQPHEDPPLKISKNSPAFNNAFDSLLSQYFTVRDALVNWDTVAADRAAYILAQKADSLPLGQIKADSSIVLTAKSLAASLGGDAKGLSAETGIEARRQNFNILTDELYNLVRTVRYDQSTIFHIKCPMAFQDSIEGYWLSNTSKVVNPYLGNKHPRYGAKMIECGEVVDSFDLVKKP